MPQERVSSHLLGLLNPAMAIAGTLSVMENSAPFASHRGHLDARPVALIETLYIVRLGWGPGIRGPFHALLFLHALCHFGGVLSLLGWQFDLLLSTLVHPRLFPRGSWRGVVSSF